MQTLLPYSSFAQSVACLDRVRLLRQRTECMQILETLRSRGAGLPVLWWRHPVVEQWRGYESALAVYATICCDECVRRGLGMVVSPYSPETFERSPGYPGDLERWGRDAEMPPWLGRADYHRSHQQALLWRLPEHYRQFGWRVVPKLDYVWPTKEQYECV
jgi:hypothetical protein